jgi:hypothetical protein
VVSEVLLVMTVMVMLVLVLIRLALPAADGRDAGCCCGWGG